ncbi:MAG: hypothetical protein WC421_03765 [Elusimicrobiales bacterium]
MKALLGKTVFIAGSEKNAGKTCFFNYALNKLRGRTRLAFLSSGLDGESEDMAFGGRKPRVAVFPGEIIATSQSSLAAADAGCEVLEVFPAATALGKMAVVRILRGGFMELSGPASNARLAEIIASLRGGFGAQTVLVDGAANRLTQLSAADGAGFVYVAKVERLRAQAVADALALLRELSELRAGMRGLFIEGALTPQRAQAVPQKEKRIVLEDCTKVFLNLPQWRAFARGRKIYFRRRFGLIFAVANLYDISRGRFAEMLKDFPPEKLVFNPYEDIRGV